MGFTNVMSLGKAALDIANELKNTELKEAILQLREEILALREENIALKEQLSKRNSHNMCFSKEDNCYYDIKNDNEKDGPFCSKCYDTIQKPVRMLNYHKQGMYKCPNCNIQIKTSEYKEDNRDVRISW